MDVTIIY